MGIAQYQESAFRETVPTIQAQAAHAAFDGKLRFRIVLVTVE
jgi:hypothetical protein